MMAIAQRAIAELDAPARASVVGATAAGLFWAAS
jgi:hypothetical protein